MPVGGHRERVGCPRSLRSVALYPKHIHNPPFIIVVIVPLILSLYIHKTPFTTSIRSAYQFIPFCPSPQQVRTQKAEIQETIHPLPSAPPPSALPPSPPSALPPASIHQLYPKREREREKVRRRCGVRRRERKDEAGQQGSASASPLCPRFVERNEETPDEEGRCLEEAPQACREVWRRRVGF